MGELDGLEAEDKESSLSIRSNSFIISWKEYK